ncbi:MAG: hypothetical protein IT376_19960, partial [Polyangiaceae bacterium]|nr:hypothetical protein [Polyangiaceae bacterium]
MGSDEHQAASERRRTGRRLATRQTAAVGASALLLAGAAACGEAPAEPQASGGSKAADSGASGDASAALPVMLSTFGGVHPGMSNIDSYGLIGFSWAPTNGSLANLTPIIEANAFFVDATGARIDAEVVPVEIDEGEPPPTPWFQLRAKRELA